MKKTIIFIFLILSTLFISAQTTDTIKFDASLTRGPVINRSCFLHGFHLSEMDETSINLIDSLKPKTWKLATFDNTESVYEGVVDHGQYPERFGTEIIFVLFDEFWPTVGGVPVDINTFGSFNAAKEAWDSEIHSTMQQIIADNMIIDYYQPFAEPDWTWLGFTSNELLILFKSACDIVTQYVPNAKFTGPDISGFPAMELMIDDFLNLISTDSINLVYLNWHEFLNYPLRIPNHVYAMRLKLNQYGVNAGIDIGEYMLEEQTLSPGLNVAYLYSFDLANVEQATRACWGVGNGLGSFSTCWAGINGMFYSDNENILYPYWIYKKVADMEGETRITTTQVADSTTGIVGFASRNDSDEKINMIIGRGISGPVSSANIQIENFPYSYSHAKISIHEIPANNNAPLILNELPNPTIINKSFSQGQTLNFELDSVASFDAFLITIEWDNASNIESITENDFSIYPNPNDGKLKLGIESNYSELNVSIYTLSGERVLVVDNQTEIDISNLLSGTYLVKITVDGKIRIIKIIKIE